MWLLPVSVFEETEKTVPVFWRRGGFLCAVPPLFILSPANVLDRKARGTYNIKGQN